MFKLIKIILLQPSHPGNIGAVARAMKTMGLTNLCLVRPKLFPHADATALAAGAEDILHAAMVVDNVVDALQDVHYVYATSARLRKLDLPIVTPKTAATQIVAAAHADNKVAVVFGNEQSGMANADFMKCHYHVNIPTSATYSSLNLAQAVQIVCYELQCAALEYIAAEQKQTALPADCLANHAAMELFYAHLEQVLLHLDFFHAKNSSSMLLRLRRLFNRSQLEVPELNILRGILSAITKQTHTSEL